MTRGGNRFYQLQTRSTDFRSVVALTEYSWQNNFDCENEKNHFGLKLTSSFHIPVSAFINSYIIFNIHRYLSTVCTVVKHDLNTKEERLSKWHVKVR